MTRILDRGPVRDFLRMIDDAGGTTVGSLFGGHFECFDADGALTLTALEHPSGRWICTFFSTPLIEWGEASSDV